MTISKQQQGEVLVNFFGLPLPEQMRAAATVLEDASQRYFEGDRAMRGANVGEFKWSPVHLRSRATDWEAEEKKADRVTELAKLLYESGEHTFGRAPFPLWMHQSQGVKDRWITAAKAALNAGYWTRPDA